VLALLVDQRLYDDVTSAESGKPRNVAIVATEAHEKIRLGSKWARPSTVERSKTTGHSIARACFLFCRHEKHKSIFLC
jgi:hypothetical protein